MGAEISPEVSKLFDWFRQDWQSGYQGIAARAPPITFREQFFARYAKLLADRPDGHAKVAEQKAEITFLDYDWGLNVATRTN